MPPSLPPANDFNEDIVLYDGGTLRDLVQSILDEPDPPLVPGGDRVDTVIATVAAHAAEVTRHRRYRRWVQTVEYLEECTFISPEGCPLKPGLNQSRIRYLGGGSLLSLVWNDDDGPVLAFHSERRGGRVRRFTWTRAAGLAKVSREERAQERRRYRTRPREEFEAVLLKLATLDC